MLHGEWEREEVEVAEGVVAEVEDGVVEEEGDLVVEEEEGVLEVEEVVVEDSETVQEDEVVSGGISEVEVSVCKILILYGRK